MSDPVTGEREPQVSSAAARGTLPPAIAESAEEAVVRAVLYADIFDFPVTRDEVFASLVGHKVSRQAADLAIDRALADGYALETDGTYLYAKGRSDTVLTRARRAVTARTAWRRARFYGRLIWAIPCVRMVAVTGALAVNNVDGRDDIDYFIVTAPGRLWMTRGMIVLLSRLARIRGDALCPNFLVTTQALALGSHDIYSAHELAQMVPLHGASTLTQLLAQNDWYLDFLPNARRADLADEADRLPRPIAWLKSLSEALLRLPPGTAIEDWERNRKIARLSRQSGPDSDEVSFTADMCKGHDQEHGRRVMRALERRIAEHERLRSQRG